jgi:hypothetical protein
MKGLWEVKIDAKKADGTIVQGGAMACSSGSTISVVRILLENDHPYADISITGYKRGADPAIHPASECGKFRIGDVIYGKYTVTDEHFYRFILSVQPDPNPALTGAAKPRPDPMGYTQYPNVPTEGIVDHDWMLDTRDMRACGYTVRIWTEDRTIIGRNAGNGYISWEIGWEKDDYVGFVLEVAP